MNDLDKFQDVFNDVVPYAGDVPKGFFVDFLGRLTDAHFHAQQEVDDYDPWAFGGGFVQTARPLLTDGEFWFEALDWVEAARKASGYFVMVTLGAAYGAQAVGAIMALRQLNPMPYLLVAVEPVAEHAPWIAKHMADNGINPDEQWILPVALSDRNDPVFFPVGPPGTSGNCFSTNETIAREQYVQELLKGDTREALSNLVLRNSTGIGKRLADGDESRGEIKLLSALTLTDVLGPLRLVDYLEADIQQSESLVFPPCIGLLTEKVRRVHIGTHGREVHEQMHELFATAGWQIVFSYAPESKFETDFGAFDTNDGVLTALNPFLDSAMPRPLSASPIQRQRPMRPLDTDLSHTPGQTASKRADRRNFDTIGRLQHAVTRQPEVRLRQFAVRLIGPRYTPAARQLMARARRWRRRLTSGGDNGRS